MVNKINHLLTFSIPQRIKGRAHVAPSLHDALGQKWARDCVEDWQIVSHASSVEYGKFPLDEPWARSELSYPTKYRFLLRNAVVSLAGGAIKVNGRLLAESIGNFYHSVPIGLTFDMAKNVARIRHRLLRLPDNGGNGYVFCNSCSYYHFISEHLIPLVYALSGNPKVGVVVRKDQYESTAFFREYLEALRQAGCFSDLRIVDVDFIEAPRYAFVTRERDSGIISRDSMELLRRILIPWGLKCGAKHGEKLFVTRTTRRFDNQDSLEQIAVDNGFEVVNPDGMPLCEQIGMFARAKAIISNHGAGLTNLIYAPNGARVLELFPMNLLNDAYFRLSASLGLGYDCMISSNCERANTMGSIEVGSFTNKILA